MAAIVNPTTTDTREPGRPMKGATDSASSGHNSRTVTTLPVRALEKANAASRALNETTMTAQDVPWPAVTPIRNGTEIRARGTSTALGGGPAADGNLRTWSVTPGRNNEPKATEVDVRPTTHQTSMGRRAATTSAEPRDRKANLLAHLPPDNTMPTVATVAIEIRPIPTSRVDVGESGPGSATSAPTQITATISDKAGRSFTRKVCQPGRSSRSWLCRLVVGDQAKI